MKKLVLVLTVFATGLFPLSAQVFNPVKWAASVEKLTASDAELQFTATIDAGWAMYAADVPEGPIPTSFTFEANNSYELAGNIIQVTKPSIKRDEMFNNMEIGQFKNMAVFRQKIKILQPHKFTIKGQVEYMCCNANSCLPPKQDDFNVKVAPPKLSADESSTENTQFTHSVESSQQAPSTSSVTTTDDTLIKSIDSETKFSSLSDPISPPNDEKSTSLWAFFLMALSAGFLGVLTPCVYPIIPMTVSFFMRDEKKRSAGIIKALIFGLSIILIYTSVGIIAALTKRADIINQIVSHWLTNLVFAAIFITFALSFFGLFEITLPSSLANKLDQKADKGGYVSAFFMALALVVISFSCTGPFVGGILVSSAQGLAIKPILGMFGFGLAFALPFTLLAFFPSLMKKLPKSGGWMNSVKIVFAFVMLAFATYFLSYADKGLGLNIFTRDVFLSIWIALSALTGYYLLGKIRFSHDSEVHYVGVFRLFIAITSFVFALYLFTGLLGAPLNAVSGLLPTAKNNRLGTVQQTGITPSSNHLCDVPKYSEHLSWPLGLQGYFDYDEALACAKEKNKPILMIFKGHTCAKCIEMESNIWPNAEVLRLMNDKYILLALYIDDNTPLPEKEYITSTFDGKVKKTMGQKNADLEITRYQINTMPYHVVLGTSGETIGQPMGYTSNPEEFINFLKLGLEKF